MNGKMGAVDLPAAQRFRWLYLLTGAAVFVYVLLRAALVGITYDEAWTITDFVPRSVYHILNYTPSDANNHLLNTLLIKLFFIPGPDTLFVARLPNVLACLVFLFFGFRLAVSFLTAGWGVSCLVLLSLNPFLLDFFGLARGYGLALGFQMISLHCLAMCGRDFRLRNACTALTVAAVAAYSSFPFLHFFSAAAVTVLAISLYRSNACVRLQVFGFAVFITAALASLIFEPIRKLIAGGDLYYGGERGFYHDTLLSLAKYTNYSSMASPSVRYILNGVLVLFFAVVLTSVIKSRRTASPRNLFIGLFALCCASVILQHLLLGTRYVIDRSALFFLPVTTLAFVFSLRDLAFRKMAGAVLAAMLVLGCLNFSRHANLYKTAIWFFDAHAEEILSRVNHNGWQAGRIMHLDYSWPYKRSFAWYTDQDPGRYPYVALANDPANRGSVSDRADYFVFLYRPLEKVHYDPAKQAIVSFHCDTAAVFPEESTVLLHHLRRSRPTVDTSHAAHKL